jgi:internalin A
MQSLCLEECRHLEDLSPLASLPYLQSLNLASCRTLRDLSSLLHVRLTALTIDRCFARDMTPLSGHPTLQVWTWLAY